MLNFDPHRWIAERAADAPPAGPTVATVATVARRASENEKSNLERKLATLATTATLSAPRDWLRALAGLDMQPPPRSLPTGRWPSLVRDAIWLAERHGEAAAGLGWSASDLFGLSDYPGEGGLADRLEGARWLAFTAGVAHWRGDDGEGWLWRRSLTAKPVIWEAME